jgi:hypothetical protein
MYKYLLWGFLFGIAALVGSLAALSTKDVQPVYASSEHVRWMAGNSIGSYPSQYFCFGVADWHDDGSAADLWAMGPPIGAGCGDPDHLSNPVWASSNGRSDFWTYSLDAVAYDGGHLATVCDVVFVQMKWYNPSAGAWQVLGYEEYIHTTSTLPGSGTTYAINIGAGYWANSYLQVGNTRWPDNAGCPTDDFHAHQMIYKYGQQFPATWSHSGLVPNTIYTQWDINAFIHDWTGWG